MHCTLPCCVHAHAFMSVHVRMQALIQAAWQSQVKLQAVDISHDVNVSPTATLSAFAVLAGRTHYPGQWEVAADQTFAS